MASRFLEELSRRVLVFDGAMGTSLQRYELTAADFGGKEGCNDFLAVTRPDVVEEVHRSYCAVGVDVLETDTFQASTIKLAEYGLQDRHDEINRAAVQVAKRAASAFETPDHPIFVAGSMGPTGMLPSSDDPALGNVTFDELAEVYGRQARALAEAGVDLLLIETQQDILETKAAIAGIVRMFKRTGLWLPIQAQVSLDTTGRMLLGTDVGAVLATLGALPIQVVGLNCSTGPDYMREPVRYLGERSRIPISTIPNAGLPLNTPQGAVYPLEPEPMAEALHSFVTELGVSIVGGCCGTTPAHLKRVVEAVGGMPRRSREVTYVPMVSSAMTAVPLHQEPKPLLVGERVNSVGSRAVKRMLIADDYDGVLQVARGQVEGGAHALDVCVAMTERTDEIDQMRTLVKKLSMGVEAPLMIDSTEWRVIEAALKQYPGRAMINSINLENRAERVDTILPLAVEHGACVVAMTIDERGMAKTAERKLEIAKRIHDIACGEYGLPPDALIFDVQTFPLVTGQEDLLDSGVQTLEGIRLIKEALPGVLTVLGVSNVSFGIGQHARAVLNSVFLYHAVKHGLDLAIVNPGHITPYADVPAEERELAEDLIYNRRPDALARYIQHFESKGPRQTQAQEQGDPWKDLPAEERLHQQILHRKKENVEALIDEALTRHTPVEVLNEVLLPAMKDVGDRFGAGELILPFVLQSAEVMKKAVAYLERFLEKKEGYTKGRVVVATVFGDVHDIGKNLVCTILGNNGYTVYDLGKQVPLNTIIEKAQEVDATAIGLSALLVSTSKQMPLCVQELHRRGLKYPVLIGGAAINRHFGYRVLYVDETTEYEPGVFYCRDAFEGLDTVDKLIDPDEHERFVEELKAKARADLNKAQPRRLTGPEAEREVVRSNVDRNVPIPPPPFWGWRVLGGSAAERVRRGATAAEMREPIALEDVFQHLDLKTLFRLHWGGRSREGADWERLIASEYMPTLERMKREARDRGYLEPKAIYGYFPARAEGNDLLVFDPNDRSKVLERFTFPRQPAWDRLCLSDYFSESEVDVLPLQIVTVGAKADELAEELNRRGDYTEGYYLHGFATQCAEALAEYVHDLIRRELGIPSSQGKRYSWGYPACPDLEEHEKLFRLLPAERIGVSLTSGYQLMPEQSTAAMVVHHPHAKYYSTLAPVVSGTAAD